MWTRRQFLSRSGLGLLGTAGTCLAVPDDRKASPDDPRDVIPDGSASKGMITARTDQAVDRALNFLYKHRGPDGQFGTAAYRGNVAVTSVAAMAFMSAGYQPNRGPYGKAVTEAVKFVLSKENVRRRFPGFLHNPDATPHGPMYGHGFGTLLLAEVSGMIHDRELRDRVHTTLKAAVKLILDAQNVDGGWRYEPDSRDADLSVTICQIMALRAARNAGIAVPKSTVERCVEYVKACQQKPDGWFRYMKQGGGGGPERGFARTAAGIVALYSAGVYKGPEIETALQYLVRSRPTPGQRPDMHYYYGHYYAVQAMWTAGGDYWQEWYPAVRDELLSRQSNEGYWVDQICTHYATAMACIILQIPNNYLPILQK